MRGPCVILDRQQVVVERNLLECWRDGVPQRVADQSNERGHGDGKYTKRRGRAPTAPVCGCGRPLFVQVTGDGDAVRPVAPSSNRARTFRSIRHSVTFRDIQLWDGLGECAMNATFGDIDVTFRAITGTFCATAPVRDGVKAENTETTGRKPVFPTEGPLVDLSDEATPGVVKTPSKLAHTPLDTTLCRYDGCEEVSQRKNSTDILSCQRQGAVENRVLVREMPRIPAFAGMKVAVSIASFSGSLNTTTR